MRCPGNRLTPRHRGQPGTARTARHAHTTSIGPGGTPRLPSTTAPVLPPPANRSATPTPSPPAPPPPPGTRRLTHHAETLTNPRHPQPPPTHTTTSPPSRGQQGKPHHQIPHATTTTTIPNPHHPPRHAPDHQPLHRPSPTPSTSPQQDQEALRLHTSGTTQHIRASTLVQAADLGEGVRDFLFDAFLHVARQERPQLATPDGESPLTTGDRVWVPPIDLGARPCWTRRAGAGGHQGPHPLPRARHGPPPTQHHPDRHQGVEKGGMGRPCGLPEQLQRPRPGRRPDPRQPAASPLHVHDPHVQQTLHPLHHPLPRTSRDLDGPRHRLPPPRQLRPPPLSAQPSPDTYTREDKPDDPHIWGTWEGMSLDTLLSIRSRNQDLGRAMYCLAKWTQPTW